MSNSNNQHPNSSVNVPSPLQQPPLPSYTTAAAVGVGSSYIPPQQTTQALYVQPISSGGYRVSSAKRKMSPALLCVEVLACLVFFVLIVGLFIYVYTLMNSKHTSTSDDNSANFGKALAEQRSHFGEEQAKFQEGFDRARAKIEETMSG